MADLNINVLLIEDTPSWSNQIQRAFSVSAGKKNFSISFLYAENIREAEAITQSRCLHGISTDQSMPETTGGEVSNDHGERYIRSLQSWDPPSYMAIYTAFPHTAISNLAGQKGIADYITKAEAEYVADNGHRYMSVTAYTDYFLDQVFVQYVRRVLHLSTSSGFSKLRAIARTALGLFDDFVAHDQSDEQLAGQFILEFFKLQEVLNSYLSAYFLAISNSEPYIGSGKADASQTEHQLRKLLNLLDNSGRLDTVKEYFQLRSPKNLSGYYIDACKSIREVRNKAVHTEWGINLASYDELRQPVVRICDMLAWFLRRPMLVSAHRPREYFIRATDVRQEFPKIIEMYFEHEVPKGDPYNLYSMLSEDEPMFLVSGQIRSLPDETTGRPKLDFDNS